MPKFPIVERRFAVAFSLTATLFFAWGLASQFNDLLLHHFQKALDLTRTQASLTQFAFYIGYFCAPLPAAMIIRRIGYKKTMVTGLAMYAIGAFLFVPAAHLRIYGIFLAALYIIAFGAAFLETSANPYIAILGDPKTASPRLNFAQAFNGVATVLGPLVGGYVIFSGVEYSPAQLAAMTPQSIDSWRASEAAAVGPPYLVLGILMVIIAGAIALTRYPPLRSAVTPEGHSSPFAVLKRPRVLYAVVAQFFYCGAQVGIWSLLVDFAGEAAHVPERTGATVYLFATMVAFCVGRFSGAWLQRTMIPARQLMLYCGCNIVLCCLAATLGGFPSIYAMTATSFFMSIMFPTIFALGLEGLGHETEFAASFIVMAISGAAVVPPLMSVIADHAGALHWSLFFPAFCYLVVLSFGHYVTRTERAAA
ncbi:MAG: L-fucose:H+ symporter permease [Alphaproteobacteria bacterium]|nr:L-fucose:H+ symporter permease [Alphaproteobacteria bacterium]